MGQSRQWDGESVLKSSSVLNLWEIDGKCFSKQAKEGEKQMFTQGIGPNSWWQKQKAEI